MEEQSFVVYFFKLQSIEFTHFNILLISILKFSSISLFAFHLEVGGVVFLLTDMFLEFVLICNTDELF